MIGPRGGAFCCGGTHQSAQKKVLKRNHCCRRCIIRDNILYWSLKQCSISADVVFCEKKKNWQACLTDLWNSMFLFQYKAFHYLKLGTLITLHFIFIFSYSANTLSNFVNSWHFRKYLETSESSTKKESRGERENEREREGKREGERERERENLCVYVKSFKLFYYFPIIRQRDGCTVTNPLLFLTVPKSLAILLCCTNMIFIEKLASFHLFCNTDWLN